MKMLMHLSGWQLCLPKATLWLAVELTRQKEMAWVSLEMHRGGEKRDLALCSVDYAKSTQAGDSGHLA